MVISIIEAEEEKFRQLRLGGEFDFNEGILTQAIIELENIQLEHSNAPNGGTHQVKEGQDIFFAIDPFFCKGYENSYRVMEPFYAKFISAEEGWGLFQVIGIDDNKLYASTWRGKKVKSDNRTIFKTKISTVEKI